MTETAATGPDSRDNSEVANASEIIEPLVPRIFSSRALSLAFGIIAPIVCFALKPILLPGDAVELPGLGFISVFWIFSYGVIGLGIASLALWLWRGPRLGNWCGVISGDLLTCALFAGLLGLVMLPFSVIGLFAIIGVLGFVPFLTAITFTGNAMRAFHQSRKLLGGRLSLVTMFLGGVLVIGVPGALQSWVSLTVRNAIRDVAAGEPSAMARLRAWYPYAHRDRLVWSYQAERDPLKKDRLARAYHDLTGEDVEVRLIRLID
jgi:hypothetical protein